MKPFRWTISKREQLGTLVDPASPRDLERHGFLSDIRTLAARTLAFADAADLAFIGRTPENLFDYLCGALPAGDDVPHLHLVQFSMRWAGSGGVRGLAPSKLAAFFDYLVEEGVDPAAISSGARPLALVDFVAGGGTLRNFVTLLHLQAERSGVDWNGVQRRLRIIGLRVRTHNSPNTWRWQQQQDWLHLIPQTVIKNVSAPAHVMWHLANDQAKLTQPFHPGLWDREAPVGSPVTDAQRQALDLAVRLYDAGSQRKERQRLARIIARLPQMRQPATRRLVSRLKR